MEYCAEQVYSEEIELNRPDFFDQIARILGHDDYDDDGEDEP